MGRSCKGQQSTSGGLPTAVTQSKFRTKGANENEIDHKGQWGKKHGMDCLNVFQKQERKPLGSSEIKIMSKLHCGRITVSHVQVAHN